MNFKDGVRIQMLINRRIKNSNKGSRRWISKLISHGEESFDRNIAKLQEQMKFINDPNVRLYSSLNTRNIEKAARLLQHRMIDIPEKEKPFFYANIHNEMVSCLMKPESRQSKLFLIDIDGPGVDPSEIYQATMYLSNEIWALCRAHNQSVTFIPFYYFTTHGAHLICAPFNTAGLEEQFKVYGAHPDITFTLKKDALMLPLEFAKRFIRTS